jgi:ABC-type transport system substrate-binding protein
VSGYDPTLRSEQGSGDLARANALLDLFGYARDADGWRRHPDGQPLRLRMAAIQDGRQRALNELWEQRMRAVGLRMDFEIGSFGELIKNSLAGRLQMWSFSWTSTQPDGEFFLGIAYGPNRTQSNDARFALPAYDRLFERIISLPDSDERLRLMRDAQRLMWSYMPYLAHSHALRVDLCQPNVQTYWRQIFTRDWWRYISLG